MNKKSDGIDMADVVAMMTGKGRGSRHVTIDDVPEDQRADVRRRMEDMERQGLGPATISRRANGSYSVLSSVRISRSLEPRKPKR